MNKSEISKIIANTGGVSKTKAREIREAIFNAISNEFKNGKEIRSNRSGRVIKFGDDFAITLDKGKKQRVKSVIEMKDGNVVYLKEDEKISKRPVSLINKLKSLGFPLEFRLTLKSIKVNKGIPEKDDLLYISAFGNKRVIGNFIISKKTKEMVKIDRESEMYIVEKLFNTEISKEAASIEEVIEDLRGSLLNGDK